MNVKKRNCSVRFTAWILAVLMVCQVFWGTGIEAKAETISNDVVVTAVTATPERVPSSGGSVLIQVEGQGLTKDNWDIKYPSYIADTDISKDSDLKATVSEKTDNSVVLTIPANTMRNDIEYRIVVSAKDGSSKASTGVIMDKKEKSVDIRPKSVEMTDNSTIVMTMEKNVVFAFEKETLKRKIYIADYSNKETNKIALTEKDQITVENNVVTITFDGAKTLSSTSTIYVEEGAFRDTSGVNLKAFSWLITSKPMITGIELQEDILDCNGGLVEGVLKGVRLNEVHNITAKVMYAGSIEESNIPVTLGDGAEPAISFEVPANNTELTQSYIIDLTMGDTPVYVQAVVSVLPEGVSATEQTLSALTISGNNKLDSGNSLTDITVKVSPQVGELKTRLNLYGTNLDSTKTEVRAIDQYGVIWPVYHIPE